MSEEGVGMQEKAYAVIIDAINAVKDSKPGDRSEIDRVCAITITDLEKIAAYFYLNAVMKKW